MSLSHEFIPRVSAYTVLKEGSTTGRVLFVIQMAPRQEHLWGIQNLCVRLPNGEVCTKVRFWDKDLGTRLCWDVPSPCAGFLAWLGVLC